MSQRVIHRISGFLSAAIKANPNNPPPAWERVGVRACPPLPLGEGWDEGDSVSVLRMLNATSVAPAFKRCMTALLGCTLFAAVAAGFESDPPNQEPPKPAEAKPATTPEHTALELFVGPWSVVETHFDELGKTVATVKGNEDVRWVLDETAIQRTYTSGTEPSLFRALGTFAFAETEKCFTGMWFNNLPTGGPSTVKGTWDAATRTMSWTTESKNKDGQTVNHRIIERFPDSKTRLVTTYVMRGNSVLKSSETLCTRKVPCPSGLRTIFEE